MRPSLPGGYRFRRFDGEFVYDRKGYVALVNHDVKEIILPDVAFKRLHGFSIYHELGHAVDSQLDRSLSRRFHQETGGSEVQSDTEEGFWMRPIALEDRGEATADAFALWVTVSYAGMKRPIFAGMPLDVQYEGIAQAIEGALLASE